MCSSEKTEPGGLSYVSARAELMDLVSLCWMAKARMMATRQLAPFTQREVRELRPAREAMHAGIKVLLEKNKLAADEIDEVFVDGVSGT